jgi:hypothetical protein
MAMFNFEFGDKQQAKKPMRSYIDIDENGRPKARVYADEYDAVKSNPDFEPFIAGAGRNMQTAQDSFADEMNEAKLEAVEKRIKAKRNETIRAEAEAREAQAEDNVYVGPDFLGSIGGLRKTFTEKATSRQEELRRLLEERAGYMGTPEISAPLTSVGGGEVEEPATEPVAPVRQTPQKRTVRIRNPEGKIVPVPAEVWNKNSKGYIEQGYQVVP